MNAEQFGTLMISLAELTDTQKGILIACLKGAAIVEDKPLSEMDTGLLSVRARRVIERGGFSLKSQLTRTALEEQRNCGACTANEILEWKLSQ